jgi:trigger factor
MEKQGRDSQSQDREYTLGAMMVKNRKKKKKKRTGRNLPRPVEEVRKEIQEEESKEEWHHVATVEELDGLNRKIHIIYDTEGVQMAMEKAIESVGKRVQVKGFRRGKAPRPLVEAHCKEEIEKSASTMLSQEGYLHACYENKFHALTEPQIEDAEFHIDGTFSCDIVLEIKPSISASGYVGLQLEKEELDREEMVERHLSGARQQHGNEVGVDEVAIGTVVEIDFAVLRDEQELSSGKDHKFMINKGQEPPFGENLIGQKVGACLSEEITLPEGYESHGGEQVMVNMEIKSITKLEPPTDEELAERMEAPSFDELVNAFRQRSDQEATAKEQQMLEEQVIDKLLEMHEFEVPVNWVDDEEKYMVSQLRLQQEPDAQMKEHIRAMAERNVRRTFMLDAIYDEEPGISVQQEEFDQMLEDEAKVQGVSKLIVKKELQQKGMLDAVFGVLKHKKVMNLIFSQATITVKGQGQKVAEGPIEIPDNPLG